MLMSGLGLCRKGEENRMVAYMEQKYGESFAVMESYAGQFGKDYTMLRMRSISRNQDGLLVRASGGEDKGDEDDGEELIHNSQFTMHNYEWRVESGGWRVQR